ncbi:MAG: AAA family ATPase, partial [Oscillospiraceae bacterium]|nr:AAA family ATPase [Oscillospiraceae bacterium]
MLQALHIENMAVIERAEIEPGPGLNVLTGETGAGKSIVIDALGAVLGARFPKELIRSGAGKASVTAQFTADGAEAWCAEHDIEPEDGCLFLSRSVTQDGRSACRVNGTPVPVSALRELGACLLDIHGQTDGQRMAEEKYHLAYLDGFAGLEAERDDYRRKYEAWAASKRELESLETDEGERERKLDLLRYQTEEIERANVQPGETETLTARREILKNAAKIIDGV